MRVKDHSPDSLGSDLLAVISRLNRWATSRATLPVPYAQARLLSLIDMTAPVRTSDLAVADQCSQPTITQALRKLDESGWIKRSADPGDARAVLISLSSRGRTAIKQTRAARSAVIAPHLNAISPTRQRQVAQAVRTLQMLLDELADGAPSKMSTTSTEGRS